jgi:transposase InsO family protein
VSESWFYKWRDRSPTPRQDRRARLADAVRAVFDGSGGTYGSPRIGDELREQGWQVSDNTIAQLMTELGLVARVKRRRRGLTRQGKRPAAPDLIKRRFTALRPDVAWCGDMTSSKPPARRRVSTRANRPAIRPSSLSTAARNSAGSTLWPPCARHRHAEITIYGWSY